MISYRNLGGLLLDNELIKTKFTADGTDIYVPMINFAFFDFLSAVYRLS